MAKISDNEKLDAIIFIDTNIFLDFYRISSSDISMKYLDQIELHKDIIITSSQVEMEFKKNRQKVILEGLSEFKKAAGVKLAIPPIVQDSKSVEMLRASKKSLEDQHKKLVTKISNIFVDPNRFDPVYKTFNTIFQNRSDINLNRENESRKDIRDLASKRFHLGYPPRKSGDTSFGDAINWEWIIDCATKSRKHIIIVTRDTDYGANYNGQPYLNDWLRQEFHQRVGVRRKIFLTDKLSTAFKLVKIPVTPEMVKEENKLLQITYRAYQNMLNNSIRRVIDQSRILNGDSLDAENSFIFEFNEKMDYSYQIDEDEISDDSPQEEGENSKQPNGEPLDEG